MKKGVCYEYLEKICFKFFKKYKREEIEEGEERDAKFVKFQKTMKKGMQRYGITDKDVYIDITPPSSPKKSPLLENQKYQSLQNLKQIYNSHKNSSKWFSLIFLVIVFFLFHFFLHFFYIFFF